jgi:hypothetical protein
MPSSVTLTPEGIAILPATATLARPPRTTLDDWVPALVVTANATAPAPVNERASARTVIEPVAQTVTISYETPEGPNNPSAGDAETTTLPTVKAANPQARNNQLTTPSLLRTVSRVLKNL